MVFPRKNLLLVASLTIGFICIGLYLFLVRPVMVKREETVKEIEGMRTKLRGYIKDPPSPQKLDRISQEKELLEKQYEEVVTKSGFPTGKSLPPPEKIGLLHLYFEQELARAEGNLERLGKEKGVQIPPRLGFVEEKPQSEEELVFLLSQVTAAQELVTMAMGTGVNQISIINPLPRAGDRFIKVAGENLFEELDIELSLRTDLSTLTKLLYQLSAGHHFFTVKQITLRSASAGSSTTSYQTGSLPQRRRIRGEGTSISSRRAPRIGSRRAPRMSRRRAPRISSRRAPGPIARQGGEIATKEKGKEGKAAEEELEVSMLICTRLLSKEKK